MKVPSGCAWAEPTTTRRGVSRTILILLPALKPEPETLTSAPALTSEGAETAGVASMAAGAGREVDGTVDGGLVEAAGASVVVEVVRTLGAVVRRVVTVPPRLVPASAPALVLRPVVVAAELAVTPEVPGVAGLVGTVVADVTSCVPVLD